MHVLQEKIDFYQENGFVHFNNVITAEELKELREAMDEVMMIDSELSYGKPKEGNYYKILNQKVNTWRDSAVMAKYSLNPRFAEIALAITGSKGIRLFSEHGLWKMPGDSKPTPWHQDLPIWPMKEQGALSMWLTLDDVDENNGCMMFIPGSYKAGRLKSNSFENPIELSELVQGSTIENHKTPVIVRMKAGSCTFHDGLTFHYAHANRTDKPRRVLAVIYMPDGTTYKSRNPQGTNDNVATRNFDFKEGDPLVSRMFPILASRHLMGYGKAN